MILLKSTLKLIRRSIGILMLSSFLLLLLNLILLLVTASAYAGIGSTTDNGTWSFAEETAAALTETNGTYSISQSAQQKLENDDTWAIFIDNSTLEVVWHSANTPQEIPMRYTAGDISALTRGYLNDYPTATSTDENKNGLMVLGFPKDRYWKHMNPLWNYDFIANSPYIVLGIFALNAALILLIYITANSRLLRSVKPITKGIEDLPSGSPVFVKEKGLLSELAAKINRTSDILQTQKAQLKKTDRARANWISGVSHDIRTPLSMVMGYAGQLEEDAALPPESRKKAATIRRQSIKMKNLINDLNLASKLEYDMQPLEQSPVNLVAAARQCTADFMNTDPDGRYDFVWNTKADTKPMLISGDGALIRRAVNNLITNAEEHNPNGCTISVEVRESGAHYVIEVQDNGIGVSDEKLNEINNTPHYMMGDGGTDEPRHGLGLLIVKQICAVHGGNASFAHGDHGAGFAARLSFPISGN